MFKKLFDRMMAAQNADEVALVLYAPDGVDMMYQKEKISWQDHERLFSLGDTDFVRKRCLIKEISASYGSYCVRDHRFYHPFLAIIIDYF